MAKRTHFELSEIEQAELISIVRPKAKEVEELMNVINKGSLTSQTFRTA